MLRTHEDSERVSYIPQVRRFCLGGPTYDCYRHIVLEPYREAFGDKHEGCMTGGDIPPHRFLFHAYTYQYHLMEFSIILIGTVSVALPPFVRTESPVSSN